MSADSILDVWNGLSVTALKPRLFKLAKGITSTLVKSSSQIKYSNPWAFVFHGFPTFKQIAGA